MLVQRISLQLSMQYCSYRTATKMQQEGQHPLTGQRAANFRLLANQ